MNRNPILRYIALALSFVLVLAALPCPAFAAGSGKRLTMVESILDDGTVNADYRISYDSRGRISSIVINKTENGFLQEILEFDDQGRKLYTTIQDISGKTWLTHNYEYDENGMLIRAYTENTFRSADGSTTGEEAANAKYICEETLYTYDAYGYPAQTETTTYIGKDDFRYTDTHTYFFNRAGRLILSEYRPGFSGTWTLEETTHKYDIHGTLTEQTKLYCEDLWTDGTMPAMRVYEYDRSRVLYDYDSQGRMTQIRETTVGLSSEYCETEYDYRFPNIILRNMQSGYFDDLSLETEYELDSLKYGRKFQLSYESETIILTDPVSGASVYEITATGQHRPVSKNGYLTELKGDGYTFRFTYQ